MEVIETGIRGCFVLKPPVFRDDRGRLVKVYHHNSFEEADLRTEFREEYYSVSSMGVLRGLHFQRPPHAHVKCITCIQGRIFDVVVDLRTNSPTYKKHFSIELDAEEGKILYVPEGLAHGFYVMTEKAIFLNRSTTVYNPNADDGIRWDSCYIDWPNKNPVLSEKDKNWHGLDEYISPF